jgi:hypothetical protein
MHENDRIRGFLRNIVQYGNMTPTVDHAPSTKVALARMEIDGLVRWDYDSGRFYLTVLGYTKLNTEKPNPGVVLSFPAKVA